MEVHRKEKFSLNRYNELKDKKTITIETARGNYVLIDNSSVRFVKNNKCYPIVGLIKSIDSDDYIDCLRFTEWGECLENNSDNRLFIIYYDDIVSEISDITIVYNSKKYKVTYGDSGDAYQGCDACALSKEASVDKRLCKICSCYSDCPGGKQFIKEIKE